MEQTFHKAARTGLISQAGDACTIETLNADRANEPFGEHLLLITISSFVFRLTVIFNASGGAATQAYYRGASPARPFNEAFAEAANLCCGALSRELSRSFPHLAMSIPYVLSGQCVQHVRALKPQYLANHVVTINDTAQMRVTLCLSCSEPLDVAACPDDDPTADTGALELF